MADKKVGRLVWDADSERLYETGVSKGVIYPKTSAGYPSGVAWNGLISVTENPSGAEATGLYADNIKYLNLRSREDFSATIEAYMYPPEFALCDGTAELAAGVRIGQQARKPFGFCYQTLVGNDVDGTDYGYVLHLVYNAEAAPSSKAYQTVNDSPEAITFSWEVSTTPVNIPGFKPSSQITINSRDVDATKLAALEDILYGKDGTGDDNTGAVAPRLPMPDEIATMFAAG